MKAILKDICIAVKKQFGFLNYDEYWDYQKNKLIMEGMKIGKNVHLINSYIDKGYAYLISIGDNVTITNATVLVHDASTKKFIGYSKVGGVDIGNNVFIGYGAIVLPGTEIGDNVIVGAGCVVSGRIPDNSIVIGNPSQIVGKCSDYIEKYNHMLSQYCTFEPDQDSKKSDTRFFCL